MNFERASPAAEPSAANALVKYSPPAARQAPIQLLDLPTELLVMICNRVSTGLEKLAFTQTCSRLRDVMCFSQEMPVPELVLMSFKAEKMHKTKLRRIYTHWIHTIADQDPFLAVCDWCMTIHDLSTGRKKYKLPAVVQRLRRVLFGMSWETRRDCNWRVVDPSVEGELVSTRHMYIQLAFKYRRMQMENPEAFELLTPENKRRLGWALRPRLRYKSVPLAISSDKVRVNCVQYPKIVADEDGELHYVLKNDITMTSTQFRRVETPQGWEFQFIPLNPSDITAMELCRHQMISPQRRNYDSSRETGEEGFYRNAAKYYGNFRSALKRNWHRIKDLALDLLTGQGPKPRYFDAYFNRVAVSDRANEALHRAMTRPGLGRLGACCPLCRTDFFFSVSKDGGIVKISMWRDFGRYGGPANQGWLQHAADRNYFYDEADLSLVGVFHRGSEAISSPRRLQDYSVVRMFEDPVDTVRANRFNRPSMMRRLFCLPSGKTITITRTYDNNLIISVGVAVDDDEGEGEGED